MGTVTVREAAELTGISIQGIYKAIYSGRLPTITNKPKIEIDIEACYKFRESARRRK